jgi:hypothetical protein
MNQSLVEPHVFIDVGLRFPAKLKEGELFHRQLWVLDFPMLIIHSVRSTEVAALSAEFPAAPIEE